MCTYIWVKRKYIISWISSNQVFQFEKEWDLKKKNIMLSNDT